MGVFLDDVGQNIRYPVMQSQIHLTFILITHHYNCSDFCVMEEDLREYCCMAGEHMHLANLFLK
jgi:hypothetical protein